nr:reverse transcriptase domain-containing protein [Tanacetum cinerariifolium]
MSTPTHTFIVPSDSDIEDAFSSTNTPDYTLASPFSASPGNTSFDHSEDLSKYLLASLAISPFHNDPYIKVMQAYNATSNESRILPQALIAPPTVLPSSPVLSLSLMFDPPDFFLPEYILPAQKRARSQSSSSTSALPQRDFDSLETELQNPRTQIAGLQKEEMGHNDEIVLARIRISTLEMIIEDIQRTSTSTAPAMTQAAIKKLVADSVAAALEAQVANMANNDNTNRNIGPRETPVARKLFSCSNCIEDCKVKFATGTLTEEALSWWNSFAQPIRIEEAYKITWSEFKKLLIKKYCPRTKVKKIEVKFFNLAVKGNNLKTYIRRFKELAVLCPTMVPNSEKLMEVFIEGLPRSVEGNVTALKPKTLEEAITVTQRSDTNSPSTYRLAPSEMQELSDQLQELADRGYHQLRVRDEDIPKTAFRTRVVQFLGHVIDSRGIHVDPSKIEAVKNCASPTTPDLPAIIKDSSNIFQRLQSL